MHITNWQLFFVGGGVSRVDRQAASEGSSLLLTLEEGGRLSDSEMSLVKFGA